MKLFGWNIERREASSRQSGEPAKKVQTGNYGTQAVYVNGQGKALGVSAWYCGLAAKANTFAQLVLEYQHLNDKSHGGNYEPYMRGFGRDMNYLTQVRPNELMTAAQMWKQAVIYREVYGNAVFYIEKGVSGEIESIWLCESAVLDVESMEYHISYKRPGGLRSTVVDAEDVWHWRNTYTYDNGLTGVGTLTYAMNALSTAATNDRQAFDIAAKGGRYKILLREEQQPGMGLNLLNKDMRDSATNDLQEALNAGDDVISINGLITPTIISQGASEMNLLQSREFDTQTIARYLGVPLVLLMDYTNNTYKAPEQAMQAFRQYTIVPMANEVEMEANAKSVGRIAYPTLRFHFNDDSLMRLDPKGTMDLAKIQLETGVKCVNELRRAMNMPSIGEEGDVHFVSANLKPLGNDNNNENE